MIQWHGECENLLVPIDSVQQHDRNPNSGDVDVIADSILANGFYNPIIVQASTGKIIAGNHRYAALLSLGVDVVPAIRVEVDDERALRILIADNRTSELSERNPYDVADILRELEETDAGLAGTAFTPEDFSELLAGLEESQFFPIAPEAGDDETQTVPRIIIYGRVGDAGDVHYFTDDDLMDAGKELRKNGWHVVARRSDD